MSIRVIFFVFFLFLKLNIIYAQVQNTVRFDTLEHDFGFIPRGLEATFTFQLINKSGAPITIDNVRATCSCTTADFDPETLLPVGANPFPVSYDARELGFFEKKVKVFVHGVRKPFILVIVGEVQ